MYKKMGLLVGLCLLSFTGMATTCLCVDDTKHNTLSLTLQIPDTNASCEALVRKRHKEDVVFFPKMTINSVNYHLSMSKIRIVHCQLLTQGKSL